MLDDLQKLVRVERHQVIAKDLGIDIRGVRDAQRIVRMNRDDLRLRAKIFGDNLMPLNAHEFLKIVKHPVIEKYKPKIVVGGPGAWQLERANRLDEFKIDYLIDGEIERVFSDLFQRIMQGDPGLQRIIKIPKEMQATVEEIPVVRHRSTFGVVEITR